MKISENYNDMKIARFNSVLQKKTKILKFHVFYLPQN
jgi:hypothetical protein